MVFDVILHTDEWSVWSTAHRRESPAALTIQAMAPPIDHARNDGGTRCVTALTTRRLILTNQRQRQLARSVHGRCSKRSTSLLYISNVLSRRIRAPPAGGTGIEVWDSGEA